MSSLHDEIAEEICNNLRPLKSRVGDLHSAVSRIENDQLALSSSSLRQR